MWRLTDRMVRSTLVTAWFLAGWPTRSSPFLEKATTDGVVREPSALGMTVASPPSRTATTELVVPRSIPTARPITHSSPHRFERLGGRCRPSVLTGRWLQYGKPVEPRPTSTRTTNTGITKRGKETSFPLLGYRVPALIATLRFPNRRAHSSSTDDPHRRIRHHWRAPFSSTTIPVARRARHRSPPPPAAFDPGASARRTDENDMTLQQLYVALLAGGLVLLCSVIAALIASRAGLPSLLPVLGLGLLLGENGLGVRFDDAQLAQNLGSSALAVSLVEGGLTTQWSDVKRVLGPAGLLATLGVGISVVATAAGAHLL